MEDIKETPCGLTMKITPFLKDGLHARPAAKLAQEARRYTADISLLSEDSAADAKSMLDIMSLSPPVDAELTLLAKGDDAREALNGLEKCLTAFQD
ncbi:MAG: HPr family phosphocarrier protein [Desulfovibrio sp.]|jgi:phosphocarrier protein|nr:HPr family phosphocarrier protein [Desulfovibrio sp.]MDR3361468.1 HPr family phosphocarrier protein [Desulfovibrio sp.]